MKITGWRRGLLAGLEHGNAGITQRRCRGGSSLGERKARDQESVKVVVDDRVDR